MAYHFMLICHLLVIPSTFHPTKVSQSYFYSLIQVWIYFQIKSAPWSRVMPDYYFCTFITDDKNNGWEKQRKHLQKQWQQIELTYFNKLNPSTPAENCHNLIYWFITEKHPHVSPLWGKYKKIRFRLLHLIFLASFFLQNTCI